MPAAPKPANEKERLESLKSYEILDTIHEKAYDDLIALAAQICDTPMAAVTLVDGDRQWFKARLGIEEAQTPREESFCSHAILKDELMEVTDARNDSRFADNKHVKAKNGIRFYAGTPLTTSDGHKIGSLCVIDRVPKRLTQAQKAFLKILSNQVEVLLDIRKKTLEMLKKENVISTQLNHLSDLDKELKFMAQELKKFSAPFKELQDLTAFLGQQIVQENLKEQVKRIEDSCSQLNKANNSLLENLNKKCIDIKSFVEKKSA